MNTLKYKIIANKNQYKKYCDLLEQLIFSGAKDKNTKDEIALVTLLIEKWDAEHLPSTDLDPIQLLRSFLRDHNLKAKDLAEILGISKGYVSDILNYKKGFLKRLSESWLIISKCHKRHLTVLTNWLSLKMPISEMPV